MTKRRITALVLAGGFLLMGGALNAAEPAAEPLEAAAEPAPAEVAGPAAECAPQQEAGLPGLDLALANPAGTPVCQFCNLNGFVNCESFDGTACNPPQPSRRCYINPPCACEWGLCRCNAATSTWDCFW